MSEPNEPRKFISSENWNEFFKEFSLRNNNRRARFDVFRGDGAVEEDGAEAYLEDVELKADGNQHEIVIVRIDRSNQNAAKMHDRITDVRGVAVQYDTDGSEDALEITDKQNNLISLRFESKVDGVS